MRRPNGSVLWYKQSSTQLLHMSFQTVQQLTKARRDSKTEATEEEVHSYLVPREGTLVALFFGGEGMFKIKKNQPSRKQQTCD